MIVSVRRNCLSVLLPLLFLLTAGCTSQTTPQPAQPAASAAASTPSAPPVAINTEAVSARLHAIAEAGQLNDLHWPNFADYRLHFQHVYEQANGGSQTWAPVWIANGQPTPQATAVIQMLEASQQKGLNPDDYDGSRWHDRVAAIHAATDAEQLANFDAALTVGVMRYISDLHIGRVNPKHFDFGIDIEQKKYDLPQFVAQSVIHAANAQTVLDGVEPSYSGYKRTQAALQHYLQLAAQGDGPPLPEVQKSIAPGSQYPAAAALARRLQVLGDLPQSAGIDPASTSYSGALVDAVKHFQSRHGLSNDGKLGRDTIVALNTPLAVRVTQLQDALERWRWLPPAFPQPPILVNVPEFSLRAYNEDQQVALTMNVVVGRALRSQTPVFTNTMRYLVLRPYWNVPTDILRGEIIPSVTKNRSYIANKGFEVTDFGGKVITDGVVSDAVLAQLRAGKLTVRQKPGATNALGLVKFMFPNEYNVYLHSTPAPQLFSQSRRDFSHGCVRVEKPAELAAYVLRNQPPWTLDKIRQAMNSGPDNQQVNLSKPIPVLILYVTAVVEDDNSVHFFNDIYGYDKSLEKILAKGQPYPG